MTFIAVGCPHGQSDQSVKRSKTARGTQRSLCQPPRWVRGSCLLASGNRGGLPAVQPTISAMQRKARGGRETARSLPLCPNPVRRALTKKAAAREAVHPARLRTRPPAAVTGDLERAGAAEVAERGAFVGDKGPPAGSGRPAIPTPARAGPPSLVAAQMRALCSAKRCGSPAGSPVTPPLSGGPPPGSWRPPGIGRAHGTPRRASASP